MSLTSLLCGCFGRGSNQNHDATLVAGVQVPGASLGAREICHDFAYRYIATRNGLPLGNEGLGQRALAVLWNNQPRGGQPARVNGEIRTRSGDLISFWDERGQLQHSLIAEGPDTWFGANNTGCFAVQGGRTRIDRVSARIHGEAGHEDNNVCGWVGTGNQWRHAMSGAIMTVTFRSSAEGLFL
ncbi:hypothetical protein [Chitinimonas lacunae]|uniref:Uncharacterized protein n=1 Tax=Chitinimonas lacunae TaxID=1963018 RepID=A0ABV8MWP3_9NEIS